MANTCGGCLMYQGSREKCGEGRTLAGTTPACSNFKGPASLFSGKKCGGCRLYKGSKVKCGEGRTLAGITPACSSYAPNPG
jgi:hypothetical protein